jgi:hypothetical protein
MKVQLSNQPRKGDVYYGVRLYDKKGKYIGSHNGLRVTKKIQWFVKDFFDMFIDELKEKVKSNPSVKLVIEKKKF